MQRFQEETVRYLYLMQILERPQPAMAATGPAVQWRSSSPIGGDGNGRRPRQCDHISRRNRRSFPAPKSRELEQARMAGSGDAAAGTAGGSRRSQSRTQRSLPLRLRQEIQEVLRRQRLIFFPVYRVISRSPRFHQRGEGSCVHHREPDTYAPPQRALSGDTKGRF